MSATGIELIHCILHITWPFTKTKVEWIWLNMMSYLKQSVEHNTAAKLKTQTHDNGLLWSN